MCHKLDEQLTNRDAEGLANNVTLATAQRGHLLQRSAKRSTCRAGRAGSACNVTKSGDVQQTQGTQCVIDIRAVLAGKSYQAKPLLLPTCESNNPFFVLNQTQAVMLAKQQRCELVATG